MINQLIKYGINVWLPSQGICVKAVAEIQKTLESPESYRARTDEKGADMSWRQILTPMAEIMLEGLAEIVYDFSSLETVHHLVKKNVAVEEVFTEQKFFTSVFERIGDAQAAHKDNARTQTDEKTAEEKITTNPDMLKGPLTDSGDTTGVLHLLTAEQIENTKTEDAAEQLAQYRKKAATRVLTFCQLLVDGAGITAGQLQRQILEAPILQDCREKFRVDPAGKSNAMLACWFDQESV